MSIIKTFKILKLTAYQLIKLLINSLILIYFVVNFKVTYKAVICCISALAYVILDNHFVGPDSPLMKDIHVVKDQLKKIFVGIFLILYSEFIFIIYGIINFEWINILGIILLVQES